MELNGAHKETLTNWGKYPVTESNVLEDDSVAAISQFIQDADEVIARGNGRCYGDSSLGPNVVSTLKMNKLLDFDPATGILECQAGVLFEDLLNVFVPKGFFPPVTPGTKFITVGGAVASDVHGKNHHSEGCFSKHVIAFSLLQSDGTIITCSREQNHDLFWKTCGGMGLTGIVLTVRFRMKPIESSYIRQLSLKARNLDHAMELFEQYKDWTYSMAWLDFLASGKSSGRSIVMVGEHATVDELPARLTRQPLKVPAKLKLNVPFNFPKWILNGLSMRAFNLLYYNKQQAKEVRNFVDYDTFFYPLDAIYNWNRIYGRNGFVQYQFVLPLDETKAGMTKVFEKLRKAGNGSFLTVLKLFGKADPAANLSFPKEGYTLALDFKVNPKVWKLLDELDKIVLEHKGHIYLTKDARVNREMYHKMLETSYERPVSYTQMGNFGSLQYDRLK